MNSLVVLGTAAAWAYSAVATFAPGVLPAGTANVYYEAAAVIVTLILLGRYLEAKAKGRTSRGDHAPGRPAGEDRARDARRRARRGLARAGRCRRHRPGPSGRQAPGRRRGRRGIVLCRRIDDHRRAGSGSEGTGREVVGGTINKTGSFTFRATKVGADTLLAQIIRMVEQAQGSKLPIQALVDQVTAWFVPAVHGASRR